MSKHLILIRDDEDYDYIYGALIVNSYVFDTQLFQNRLKEMRKEVGYDDNYNGVDFVSMVLKKYSSDYKDIEFVGISTEVYI